LLQLADFQRSPGRAQTLASGFEQVLGSRLLVSEASPSSSKDQNFLLRNGNNKFGFGWKIYPRHPSSEDREKLNFSTF
jgi:hypothetical protein